MIDEKKLTGYPSIDRPWLKYYSDDAKNAPLPECTIYEYLYENNKDYPSDIAFNYLGRKINYKELFENIDKTAAAFLKAGVKEKEIVTVALPSIPEALYCVYALNKIGAVANMIHPLAGKEETLFYFNEVQSRIAVIYDGAYTAIADEIGKSSVETVIVTSPADSLPPHLKVAYKLKAKAPKIDNKTFLSWKTFIRNSKGTPVKAVKKNCREMAIISHTGGTTGVPKGVMCSDYNIDALIWQIGCNLPHVRQERYMVVLPPFINYSLVNAMLEPLAFGFQVVLIPDYKPEKFAEYIKKYRANHISSIPAYWEVLLSLKEPKSIDFSSLNHIYYGGETMPIEKEDAINELLLSCGARNKLCKGLGSTEMMSAATVTYEDCNKPGSVGIPLAKTNCKIAEPDSTEELSYGQIGEICFTGPTLMMGYYNKPEVTDDIVKIHADGQRWLHTGDLGYLDENGVLYVTGRIKRILMTKGRDGNITKIFPDRIEKTVYEHEAVAICCAIGVPDEMRINYPVVYVVCKPEAGESEQITEQILALCQKELPDYMVPEAVIYRDDLPRTPRGKVDYRELEKMAEEEM